MILRASARKQIGGDVIQLRETARELRNLGWEIDIIYTDTKIFYDQYDLLHFSNVIRPSDILRHILTAKKPYVISTIFVEYSPEDSGIHNSFILNFFRMFPHVLEYFKTLIRGILKKDILPHWSYVFMGQKLSIKYVIKHADHLLPNSESEIRRLENSLKMTITKYTKIVNGVAEVFLGNPETVSEFHDAIFCVGRIEPLKNQLSLIKAAKNLPYRFYFVGSPSANIKYFEACIKESGDNVMFISKMTQDELAIALSSAKVHALLSFFETTGLASLEAGACGCNLLVTRGGDQSEYFEGIADFCNPNEIENIRSEIIKQMEKPRNCYGQRDKIRTRFTWKLAAANTDKVYRRILREIDE